MLINKSQLTGFTLLVASFLFIPQVNADMRNEFNQQQNKQQKDNQERKELCSFVLANAQFKSENQHPVLHYYVIKPHIVEIEDVSDESNVGSKWSGKYCLIKKHPYIGTPQKIRDVGGGVATYTLYIEDGKLVEYLKNSSGYIGRRVLGVKK